MRNTISQNSSRNANVRACVPEDVKRKWQDAALMRGQTLTDFLIVAANKETTETFLEHERVELSQRAQVQFAEMLLRPPQSNETMTKVIKKRLEHMEGDRQKTRV